MLSATANCYYESQSMARIKLEELEDVRERHRDQKIVFSSGCFDLIHAGHMLFLEDCKKHGDILVVMVGSDEVIRRDKGTKRPIMNEHLRIKMTDSLKPVDYTFLDRALPGDPYSLYFIDVVFGKLKPDVYVINTDAYDIPYRENFSKKHSVLLVILNRTAPPEFDEVSTTKIIQKIKSI